MKTNNLIKKIAFTFICILMLHNMSFSQTLYDNCGADVHGYGDVDMDCFEDVIITSTEEEGSTGTIISGIITTTNTIRITSGYSFVKLVPETETEGSANRRTHTTKIGNGGNTGGTEPPYSFRYSKTKPLSIYPNPTKDNLSITTNNSKLTGYKLYNIYGRLLKNVSIKVTNNYTMLLVKLKSGIYILKLYLENGDIITKNIIKQ